MWSIPICCLPSVWLSLWWVGAAITTASRLPRMPALREPPKLRTQLLSLHAQTLKLNPCAGLKSPRGWLQPRLHLAKPGCEGN